MRLTCRRFLAPLFPFCRAAGPNFSLRPGSATAPAGNGLQDAELPFEAAASSGN